MPAAIVIGAPPHVSYTAVTRIPNDMCEYDVAGGLVGHPVEVVRCVTQDLLVPAEAEIVIEGTVPTDVVEMEGAFGEFPGYMAQRDYSFFMDVTAITMRKKPIYHLDPQPDAAERKQQDAQYRPRRRRHPAAARRRHG